MASRGDLSALLSQALVAFTIEFDNESEHRSAHRTTAGGSTAAGDREPDGGDGAGGGAGGGGGSPRRRDAPWLVSQVLWENVMRHIDADGVSVHELQTRARTSRLLLNGLRRWGYIKVVPASTGRRAPQPRADDLVRPTAAGRHAQDVWRPLAAEVEGRWRVRFGEARMGALRRALHVVVDQFEVDLPLYVPIVFPTNNGRAEVPEPRVGVASRSAPTTTSAPTTPGHASSSGLDLSALFSQVLLQFTIDFERESKISLPISANTLRVLAEAAVRVRDLPVLTGVSKEANAMVIGFLERHGCVVMEADPSATRGKIVRLTPKGQQAQDKYRRLIGATEEHWDSGYGPGNIADLRASLAAVVGKVDAGRHSPLFDGLVPYPDGWRASVRAPETLPYYPMVLHRGGYPDGA